MDEVREFTAPSRLLNQPLLSFLLLTALYVSYGLLAGLSTQIISPAASSAWLCSVGTDGGWDGWVLCLEEHRQGHRPIYNILKRQTQSHCSAVGTFSPRTNLKKKRVFAITTTKNQLESFLCSGHQRLLTVASLSQLFPKCPSNARHGAWPWDPERCNCIVIEGSTVAAVAGEDLHT